MESCTGLSCVSTSSSYPYSEPYSGQIGTTFISETQSKWFVDAYNGDVNYYVVDDKDPVRRRMRRCYPTLLQG